MGNVSLVVASLFSSTKGVTTSLDISISGSSGCFSVTIVSVEADEVVVSRSTRPKTSSKVSNSVEVLVPARAIFICTNPSQCSCAAFSSK